MSRPRKEFQEYIVEPRDKHVTHEDYIKSPATAFLRYTVEAKDAVNHCQRHFSTNKDGTYSKDSRDSLQHILSAFLPSIMGHFETYERYLFAGVFEESGLLGDFDADQFFRYIDKNYGLEIDPIKLSAYRGFDATVGIMLADNMPGWHNPRRVNSYFKALGFETNFFSADDCTRLNILWQLRHSIVHTGGSITLPDAQKVEGLRNFGNQPIVFDDNFVFEVSRKMHPLVKEATARLRSCFKSRMQGAIPEGAQERVDNLFKVRSSVGVWLKNI